MPQIAVTVPYGVTPGMTMKAKTPDGRAFLIPVPQGARPGMTLMVTIPDSPPGQKIETSDIGAEVMQQGTTMVEGVNTDDLVMVCAALCIICSCYPKFPDCLGAHAKAVITCMEVESLCCKVGKADGSICMCMKNEIEIVKPTTCVKQTSQFFCIDLRCAIPCDEEVPCTIGALGLICVKEYKCICKCGEKMSEKEEGGGAPPVPEACAEGETMERETA